MPFLKKSRRQFLCQTYSKRTLDVRSFNYLPVLNEVILVLDLNPCPILKGNFFLAFLFVNAAKLSKPSKVFAIDDFPTPCCPSITNLGLGSLPCSYRSGPAKIVTKSLLYAIKIDIEHEFQK